MPEALAPRNPVDSVQAAARPAPHTLLYLDGVTISFDGFKALDGLSLIVDKGEDLPTLRYIG